jgi:hypothetical protein
VARCNRRPHSRSFRPAVIGLVRRGFREGFGLTTPTGGARSARRRGLTGARQRPARERNPPRRGGRPPAKHSRHQGVAGDRTPKDSNARPRPSHRRRRHVSRQLGRRPHGVHGARHERRPPTSPTAQFRSLNQPGEGYPYRLGRSPALCCTELPGSKAEETRPDALDRSLSAKQSPTR